MTTTTTTTTAAAADDDDDDGGGGGDMTLTSRLFSPSDAECAAAGGPMAAAIAWAAAAAPEPALVLAHELSACSREYEALTAEALSRWAREPFATRLAHEVIVDGTPAKLFVDVDLPLAVGASAAGAAARADVVAERLEAALRARFGALIVATDVLVLDASAPGVKVSRHIVIEATGVRGEPVRFANAAHVGAFVRTVERANSVEFADMIDYGVYTRNHCFRTYGSTKADAPDRVLRLLGAEARTRTLDLATLERSLVTWPRVREPTLLYLDDAELSAAAVGAKRRRPSAAAPPPPPRLDIADLAALLAPAIGGVRVRSLRVADARTVFVDTYERECPHKGAEHGSSTAYFVVDALGARVMRLCRSPKCADMPRTWTPLEDATAAAMRARIGTPSPVRRALARSAPARLGDAPPSSSSRAESPPPPPPSPAVYGDAMKFLFSRTRWGRAVAPRPLADWRRTQARCAARRRRRRDARARD